MSHRSLLVVYPLLDAETDGIRDYSVRLVESLGAQPGVEAKLTSNVGSWRRQPVGREYLDELIVQYQPFSYGQRGFAPGLVASLINCRASRRRPRIVLMVHEPYCPMIGWRWTLMGLWQRAQLRALYTAADVACASTEVWARLGRNAKGSRSYHLPVGSNLPDMSSQRVPARERLGAAEDDLVIATFGMPKISRLLDYIAAAANALAQSDRRILLLNLGAGAPDLDLDPSITLIKPGIASATSLATHLAASDLFLGAWEEGASTHRTTLMAAMQHGVPVTTTLGPLTDSILRRSTGALELVPGGDRDAFARAACRLGADPERRRAVGRAGKALYHEQFDWPVTARRLIEFLDAS